MINLECIGNYHKRLGCLLPKLKNTTKGLKELTEAIIDKLQNYFAIALRANYHGTEKHMADAIRARFLQVSGNIENHYRPLCRSPPTSWCHYQRDQCDGTNLFKHGLELPKDVIAAVKPIYKDLIKQEKLEKCMDGKNAER